ncbi:MAG: hypothetical protein ACI8QZ_003746 [Chlamydiales bacterium]|jgi:hypothetical protein
MNTLWIPSLLGAVSLITSVLTPTSTVHAPTTPKGDGGAVRSVDAPSPLQRVVQRTNSFTGSSQDASALTIDRDGNWVVTWHSRRQQEGSYGIYARRLDPTGKPIAAERAINDTVSGMQMQPCVVSDDQGGTWFAWRSFEQDGDQGSVVARRFDSKLERATGEIEVNETVAGHQSDPSIAALPGGGALVIWTGPASCSGRLRIHGRRLARDGRPQGPEFILGQAQGQDRLPHVGTDDSGRAVVCWARTTDEGLPLGIFAQAIDRSGQPAGAEFRVDSTTSLQPVEPTLSMTGTGKFAIAWIDLSAQGAPLFWRTYDWQGDAITADAPRQHLAQESGYTSGHAIDLDEDGSLLLAWSQHSSTGKQTRLFAQVFDAEGHAASPAWPVNTRSDGVEKLAVGRGTSRVARLRDGRMGFAWHGDGGQGDSSGAHISVLLPDAFEIQTCAQATIDQAIWEGAEKAAMPHELPSFSSRRALRQATPGSTPLLGQPATFSIDGILDTGATPPDPHLAVGPDHMVQVTNGRIQFRNNLGGLTFDSPIQGGGGFWGTAGAGNFVIDPEVIWDPHAQRFMAVAAEIAVGGTRPYYLLAVSDDADPGGMWFKYRIDVLASAGDPNIDSPNIAVDENVVYLTANFLTPDIFHLLLIDKSSVIAGGVPSYIDHVIPAVHSFGVPITYDAGAPAQYMIHAEQSAGSNKIDFWAITDPLTSPVFQSTTLTLPTIYTDPESAPQLGTSIRIELFDTRFWSCVYRNGSLWATHHSGVGQAIQIWYQFDMQGWPGSGNQPVLVQSGSLNLGLPIRTFFGSIGVDADDNMALTFARSSPDEFISMAQVTRAANDPLGATQPPVTVMTSTGPGGDRWGDYSACVPDPDEPGTFWACHEYTDGVNWKTRIARFQVCPLGESYCVSATHSGGQQALIATAGTPRVSNNEFFLTVSDGPPNKFGVFFYGPNMIQVTFGDGFRCVGGQTQRLNPIAQLDSSGTLSRQLDLTTLQTAAITPDTSWNFQFWFRDPMGPGGSGFNLTDAVAVTFCE